MSHYQILTLNHISAHGLHRFPAARYTVGKSVEQPDAIVLRSHNMHAMTIPASVRAIGRAGAGTNNIPVAAMSQRGVPVFNAPGANANAVKELVLAGILVAARNVCQAWAYVRDLPGEGEPLEREVERGKKQFAGFELPGKTLGVVGLGAIGVEVANSAHALGMRVLGYDPQITVQRAWQLSSGVEQAMSVDDLFARSDLITLHVPLVDETHGFVNAARLRLVRPGAVLLNFARGAIVDEPGVRVHGGGIETDGVGAAIRAQRHVGRGTLKVVHIPAGEDDIAAFRGCLARKGATDRRRGAEHDPGPAAAGGAHRPPPRICSRRARSDSNTPSGSTRARTCRNSGSAGYIRAKPSGVRQESLAR